HVVVFFHVIFLRLVLLGFLGLRILLRVILLHLIVLHLVLFHVVFFHAVLFRGIAGLRRSRKGNSQKTHCHQPANHLVHYLFSYARSNSRRGTWDLIWDLNRRRVHEQDDSQVDGNVSSGC